ncbi:MAG TPA: TadE/TadG family type IV pilus assembly protein [Vicinamibacterales bacterium]|jgi:Flp pilus assembly protein TadG
MNRRLIARLREARGATLVEAAIVTPLLLLLTFSVVDFGSMFYVYLALENGVSQATRDVVTGATVGSLSREDSIRSDMRSETPTLTIPDSAFTFSHMAVGGTSFVGGAGGPGDIERVTVDYDWQILTPLMRPFFANGTIHFTVQSTMKNESKFQ